MDDVHCSCLPLPLPPQSSSTPSSRNAPSARLAVRDSRQQAAGRQAKQARTQESRRVLLSVAYLNSLRSHMLEQGQGSSVQYMILINTDAPILLLLRLTAVHIL